MADTIDSSLRIPHVLRSFATHCQNDELSNPYFLHQGDSPSAVLVS